MKEFEKNDSECSGWNEIDEMVSDESEFPGCNPGGIKMPHSEGQYNAAHLLNSRRPYNSIGAEDIVQVSGSIFTAALAYLL